MGKPTPEQLARINQLARTPLSEDDVYVFPDKMVGDKVIPHRAQRIMPNALAKMADQAKQGVSLLLDHSWANLGVMTIPLGRTFDAKVQQEPDGELAVYADHYMRLGQTINGISTDELAMGIDAGTIFDTSVGFIGMDHTCSICGEAYFGNSNCPHIAGQMYDGVMCVMQINDVDLMENSLVFDGAYPGAGIVGMSGAGTPKIENKKMLALSEDTKSLSGDGRIFYSFSSKSGLRGFVLESDSKPERDDSVNELEQARQQLSVANGYLAIVRTALGVQTDAEIEGTLTKLAAKAQIGEQYAARVVDEACGAGVRALGDAFNVDSMKAAFSALPVSEVEKIRDTYEAQAKTALGGGGRHTLGNDPELPKNPNANGNGELTEEEKLAKAREEARASLAKIAPKQLKDGE